jgi:hypothetical protein
MNLLNILLASSLIALVIIGLIGIDNVTEQIMLFLGLLILGLVISLLLPKSFNNANQPNQPNQLTSLNSKVYQNQNNIVVDNVHLNNVNALNSVNNVNNSNNPNNINSLELNNLKKMLEADKQIYQQLKVRDQNKINNFRDLHNPPIPNNKSDDCVANLSCVIKEC